MNFRQGIQISRHFDKQKKIKTKQKQNKHRGGEKTEGCSGSFPSAEV